MAKLVIFGELGSKEVSWQIPNFIKVLKDIKDNTNIEFVFEDQSKSYTLKVLKPDFNEEMFVSIHLGNNVVSDADLISAFVAKYRIIYSADYNIIFNIGNASSGKFCRELGFPRRILCSDLLDFGGLEDFCIVWTPGNVLPTPTTKPVSQSAVVSVVDDLEKAFSNMQFSDIQLLCNGEKFDCHKVILAARSPVFNAMFIHEMKENINKEVKLDSMKPKILKEMLSYIYCGKVKDLKETCDAMDLLKVADQYQLEGLKDICGSFLSSILKADNALDLLTLAESCNENHLKKSTMDWLVRNQNIKSLMKTKRWEELEEKFPRLLVDVMKVVVDQKL